MLGFRLQRLCSVQLVGHDAHPKGLFRASKIWWGCAVMCKAYLSREQEPDEPKWQKRVLQEDQL